MRESLCVIKYWICTWQRMVEVIWYVHIFKENYVWENTEFKTFKTMCDWILNLYLAEHGWSYATARIDAKAIKPQNGYIDGSSFF